MKTKARLVTAPNPDSIAKTIKRLGAMLDDRLKDLCQSDRILKEITDERAREQERHLREVEKFTIRRNARLQILTAQRNEELVEVRKRLDHLVAQLTAAKLKAHGPDWVRGIIERLKRGVDWSGQWRCLWVDDQSGWCVLRKSGGKCWSGRGNTNYAPIITALFSRQAVEQADKDAGSHGFHYAGSALLDKLATRQHRGAMSRAMLESWVVTAL